MLENLRESKNFICAEVAKLERSFDGGMEPRRNAEITRQVETFLREARAIADEGSESLVELRGIVEELQMSLNSVKNLSVAWRVDDFIQLSFPSKKRRALFESEDVKRSRGETDYQQLLSPYRHLTRGMKEQTVKELKHLKSQTNFSKAAIYEITDMAEGRAEPLAYFAKFIKNGGFLRNYKDGISLFLLYQKEGKERALYAVQALFSEDTKVDELSAILKLLSDFSEEDVLEIVDLYKECMEGREVTGEGFFSFVRHMRRESSEKRREAVEGIKSINNAYFFATNKRLSTVATLELVSSFLTDKERMNLAIGFLLRDTKSQVRKYSEEAIGVLFGVAKCIPVERLSLDIEASAKNIELLETYTQETLSLAQIAPYFSILQIGHDFVEKIVPRLPFNLQLNNLMALIGVIERFETIRGTAKESITLVDTLVEKTGGDLEEVCAILQGLANIWRKTPQEFLAFSERIIDKVSTNQTFTLLLERLLGDNYVLEDIIDVFELVEPYSEENVLQLFTLTEALFLFATPVDVNDSQRRKGEIIENLHFIEDDFRDQVVDKVREIAGRENLDGHFVLDAIVEVLNYYPIEKCLEDILETAKTFFKGTNATAESTEYISVFLGKNFLEISYVLGQWLKTQQESYTASEVKDFLCIFNEAALEKIEEITIKVGALTGSLKEKIELCKDLASTYSPIRKRILQESEGLINERTSVQAAKNIWKSLKRVPIQCLPGFGSAISSLVGELEDPYPEDMNEIINELAAAPQSIRDEVVEQTKNYISAKDDALEVTTVMRAVAFVLAAPGGKEALNRIPAGIIESLPLEEAEQMILISCLLEQSDVIDKRVLESLGFNEENALEEVIGALWEAVLTDLTGHFGDIGEIAQEGSSLLKARKLQWLLSLEKELMLREGGQPLGAYSKEEALEELRLFLAKEIERMLQDPGLAGPLYILVTRMYASKELLGVEEDSELEQRIIGLELLLADSAQAGANGMYILNYELQEKIKGPFYLESVDILIDDIIYHVNLKKFLEGVGSPEKVSYKQLKEKYPDIHPGTIREAFANFQNRVKALSEEKRQQVKTELMGYVERRDLTGGTPEERERESAEQEEEIERGFDVIQFLEGRQESCVGTGKKLQSLLQQTGEEEDETSLLQQEAYALVQHIVDKSSEEGGALTEQERALLGLSFAINACSGGQVAGIHLAYRDLTNQTGQNTETFLAAGKVEDFLADVIPPALKEAESLLSQEDPIYKDLVAEVSLSEFVHQQRYVKNLLSEVLHLNHEFEFDEYIEWVDEGLRELSSHEVLEVVVDALVDRVCDTIILRVNEVLRSVTARDKKAISFYNTLTSYIEGAPDDMYTLDEKDNIAFTKAGARQLLKQAGYILSPSVDNESTEGEEESKVDL